MPGAGSWRRAALDPGEELGQRQPEGLLEGGGRAGHRASSASRPATMSSRAIWACSTSAWASSRCSTAASVAAEPASAASARRRGARRDRREDRVLPRLDRREPAGERAARLGAGDQPGGLGGVAGIDHRLQLRPAASSAVGHRLALGAQQQERLVEVGGGLGQASVAFTQTASAPSSACSAASSAAVQSRRARPAARQIAGSARKA